MKKDWIYGIGFSLLRVWLGIQWFKAGLGKIFNPAWTGEQAGVAVSGYLRGAIAKATGENPIVQQWYAHLLENYMLPNATFVSHLVAWGEVLVGIALVLGVFTYFSATMGALMNLNFMLAGTLSSNPIMYTIAFLIMLGIKHAKFMSVDRYLETQISIEKIKTALLSKGEVA